MVEINKINKKNMNRLKIFGYAWHTSHQYSLMKALPECKFYYIRNNLRTWSKESRPEPENLNYVDHYEPGKYDLAILHLDQQCIYDQKKGTPYMMMNKQITDIPKIVINHGSPHYAEKSTAEMVERMREIIGDNLMIVNSEQACKEWKADKYIIHGISGQEFRPLKKSNRIITTLNPNYYARPVDGWFDYYNRQFFADVKEKVKITHIGSDKKFNSFDEYRKYVGESLIYFNTTIHSPMPRSRTEAMLAGCCVVSTGNHDWDKYIRDGENGFIINGQDVKGTVKLLKWLKKNPTKTRRIGLEGRKTALEFFDPERYRKEWQMTINQSLNNHILGEETRKLKKDIEDLLFICTGQRDEHQINVLKTIIENYSKKITKI